MTVGDQPQHPAPIHSIERMHDIVLVEYRYQTLHGSGRVGLPRLNVFPKDAPGVLDSAQDRLLVGIIHYTEQLHRTGIQDPKGSLVPSRSVALPRRTIADFAATLFVRGLCEGEVARHSRAGCYRIQGHQRHADQRNSQTAYYQRYVVVGWHRLARARKTGVGIPTDRGQQPQQNSYCQDGGARAHGSLHWQDKRRQKIRSGPTRNNSLAAGLFKRFGLKSLTHIAPQHPPHPPGRGHAISEISASQPRLTPLKLITPTTRTTSAL